MKKKAVLFVLCFFCAFARQVAMTDELSAVLRSAGHYCDKVKDIALYYVAKETVEDVKFIYRMDAGSVERQEAPAELLTVRIGEKKYVSRGTKKRVLVYDYQLISRAGRYEEMRTLLEENGKKSIKRTPS